MPAQNDDNCIFCNIVKGDVPSKKVLEDDDFLAILDINPAVSGHTIVIPKNHYFVAQQMPPQEGGKLGVFCKKISKKLLESLPLDGTSVFIANGGAAGQRVPHFVAHVIPRKADDGIQLNPGFTSDYKKEQQEILSKMKQAINPPGSQGAVSKQVEEKPKRAKNAPDDDDVDLDKIRDMFG